MSAVADLTPSDNQLVPTDATQRPAVDLCVIGGGVNGAGIARDAAGRGLSVLLVEKDDLAEGTSSRSGKLVHGGLRYLEHREFRLVRDALIEREVLLEAAPHIIWPMRFVLPHSPNDRPAWLIRLGLFLYDHLGGRKRLPGTRVLDLHKEPEGNSLNRQYRRAFEYSDCWVDDARLVVLNALDAKERGAEVMTRTRACQAQRAGDLWQITLAEGHNQAPRTVTARALVNAAGPWVEQVLSKVPEVRSRRRIRLVKGSHIIVRQFWEGEHAYLLQNDDKRVIFVNPYEQGLALIGTTDIPYEGDAADVEVDDAEIDYLLAAVNRYTKTQLQRSDVLHSFSGVRPLYDDNSDDPSTVTRDYLFDLDSGNDGPVMLNVYGGKITTYRKLAERAVNLIVQHLGTDRKPWTASEALPGGDIADADVDRYLSVQLQRRPQLPEALIAHYVRLYGSRIEVLLDGIESVAQLGRHFGHLLYECEADYLIRYEWARSAADILERRTKHGLHLNAAQTETFVDWFKS